MTIEGRIGTKSYSDDRARGTGHPPVLRSGEFAASDVVLPVGTVLMRNGAGKLAPWETDTVPPAMVGVLDEALDTDASDSALYVRHGSVRQAMLKKLVSDEFVAVAAADIKTLEDAGIFPE